MMSEMCSDHQKTKCLLTAREIKVVQKPWAYSILVTNVSKKLVSPHKHIAIAVKSDPPSAVFLPGKGNLEQARDDGETDNVRKVVSIMLMPVDQTWSWNVQMYGHEEVKISDKSLQNSNLKQ